MDAIKLLRIQVVAKVAYLESERAFEDACGEGADAFASLTLQNEIRAEAFREVLADIDALTTTTAR